MSLLSAIGGLIGLSLGGPLGAALGSGIGTLAGGGDIGDALKSGLLGFGIGSIPELKAACQDPLVEQVITVATRLEGLSRHASVHAAGVVIGDVPLMEVVPLMRDQSGTGIVTQFDMNSVEALGLLKMDFLGLRTLTFLEECTRIVAETGDRLEIAKIPLDDRKTFDFLAKGETEGVFQLESPGMSQTVRALRPTRLEDLIALVSLYRPGPMEQIPTYIRRAHGEEPVRYDEFPAAAELLEPILGETYGIPVYQEQIMQIASAVAGYSLGEADLLRRAMGKKKLSEMVAQREKFLAGAQKQGVPGGEASALFDLLEKFANYGFNKSHAAAYALISYQTAYVKAHFPVAFQAALLSVEQKDTDKLAEYIRAARVAGEAVRAARHQPERLRLFGGRGNGGFRPLGGAQRGRGRGPDHSGRAPKGRALHLAGRFSFAPEPKQSAAPGSGVFDQGRGFRQHRRPAQRAFGGSGGDFQVGR